VIFAKKVSSISHFTTLYYALHEPQVFWHLLLKEGLVAHFLALFSQYLSPIMFLQLDDGLAVVLEGAADVSSLAVQTLQLSMQFLSR